MTRTFPIIAVAMAFPAISFSQEIQLENCAYQSAHVATCDITNSSDTAFQSLAYRAEAIEAGRTYPWGETNGQLIIAGGVEPDETIEVAIEAPDLPDRADIANVTLKVSGRIVAVRPNIPNDYSVIQQCWNVGSLSSAALNAVIEVSFLVSGDGRVDSSLVELVDGYGANDDAIQQSFEAARRAIVRCGVSKGSLPPGQATLRFDSRSMTVKP